MFNTLLEILGASVNWLLAGMKVPFKEQIDDRKSQINRIAGLISILVIIAVIITLGRVVY